MGIENSIPTNNLIEALQPQDSDSFSQFTRRLAHSEAKVITALTLAIQANDTFSMGSLKDQLTHIQKTEETSDIGWDMSQGILLSYMRDTLIPLGIANQVDLGKYRISPDPDMQIKVIQASLKILEFAKTHQISLYELLGERNGDTRLGIYAKLVNNYETNPHAFLHNTDLGEHRSIVKTLHEMQKHGLIEYTSRETSTTTTTEYGLTSSALIHGIPDEDLVGTKAKPMYHAKYVYEVLRQYPGLHSINDIADWVMSKMRKDQKPIPSDIRALKLNLSATIHRLEEKGHAEIVTEPKSKVWLTAHQYHMLKDFVSTMEEVAQIWTPLTGTDDQYSGDLRPDALSLLQDQATMRELFLRTKTHTARPIEQLSQGLRRDWDYEEESGVLEGLNAWEAAQTNSATGTLLILMSGEKIPYQHGETVSERADREKTAKLNMLNLRVWYGTPEQLEKKIRSKDAPDIFSNERESIIEDLNDFTAKKAPAYDRQINITGSQDEEKRIIFVSRDIADISISSGTFNQIFINRRDLETGFNITALDNAIRTIGGI